MNKDKKTEKIISEALKLYEKGKTVDEIVLVFPEYENEIRGVLSLTENLESGRNFFNPKEEFFSNVLQKIEPSVTNPETARYIYNADEEQKGRFGRHLKSKNIFMKNFWKFGISAAVIAIVAVVFLAYNQPWKISKVDDVFQKDIIQETINQVINNNIPTPRAVSSNSSDFVEIDDIISGINDELGQEIALSQEYEEDLNFIVSDLEVINDIEQTYDEATL